jgi:ribonuclease P protein subunit RPR2
MAKTTKFKTTKHKIIALERINELFVCASHLKPDDKKLADRYVYLARRIAMKFKVRIPQELKKRYCPYCYAYRFFTQNSRVRTKNNKLIISCSDCKNYYRFPLIGAGKNNGN